MKKQDKKIDEPKVQDAGLNERVANLEKEIEEWKNKYIRAIADYQNLERRTKEEKDVIRMFASEIVLARLFPAIDTLKKAKDHIKDAGLDLAYKEFLAVLEEQGVVRIETVGKEFNPHQMECIEVVEGEENIVTEELLPGYLLYDKVLRVAQVKVGKQISKSTNDQSTNK